MTEFLVAVQRGTYFHGETFYGEKKARDYYTDMLVKYPDANVTISQHSLNKK